MPEKDNLTGGVVTGCNDVICNPPMFPPSPGCDGDPTKPQDPNAPYNLKGPQVEPEAGYWSVQSASRLPRVVTIDEVTKYTEDEAKYPDLFVPPYPRDPKVLAWEIRELVELQSQRDDSSKITGQFSEAPPPEVPPIFRNTTRLDLSDFLQLDPPPFGAIFNIGNRPQFKIENINQQHLRRQQSKTGVLPPVVCSGRQLARMFEGETPGLAHHNALNYLFYKRPEISPPRQARIWMALDVVIYSALAAAWYYKWAARNTHSYRQRPFEWDQNRTFRVLYDDVVDDAGLCNKCPGAMPCPSAGTPRHPAYPSGHSSYSAAASELLSLVFPDERVQFERLADNIGTARLWAGVHWRSDHIAGQRVGKAVARALWEDQLQHDCIPRFNEPVDPTKPEDVPTQSAIKDKVEDRRSKPCDPQQNTLPTQRSTPFDDCRERKATF